MERPKPKTYADRQLERAEALQRQQEMLTGSGERPCSITSADIPDQVARPRASKVFVVVGLTIIILLVAAQCILSFSKPSQGKQRPKPVPVESVETE